MPKKTSVTRNVTLRIPSETLQELDTWAERFHCTRNALITIWLGQTMASMKAAYNSIPASMQTVISDLGSGHDN